MSAFSRQLAPRKLDGAALAGRWKMPASSCLCSIGDPIKHEFPAAAGAVEPLNGHLVRPKRGCRELGYRASMFRGVHKALLSVKLDRGAFPAAGQYFGGGIHLATERQS